MTKRSVAFDKESQRQAKREEIIYTAGRLFCKRGVLQTTLDDIASEMGIAKTLIYYYFGNKNDIFVCCHQIAVAAMENAWFASADDDPVRHIQKFISRYVRDIIGENNPGAVLLDDELLPEDVGNELRERKQKILKHLECAIARGVFEERMTHIDPKAAAIAIMSALNILPRWYDKRGYLTVQMVADTYANMFAYGIVGTEIEMK